MIFASNDVRNFHFDVVNHVDEMENPRSIWPADCHIRMRSRIGEIEIDFAADKIVHDHMLTRRAETQSARVFEDVARVLKSLEVAFVNFGALALKVRTEIAADVRAFVPI